MPVDGCGSGHEQSLRKQREINAPGWGNGTIPRIDDVSSCEHSEPCEYNHCDQVDLQESLTVRFSFRRLRRMGEEIKLHQRTRTGQQIECAKSHAVYQSPKATYRNFHLLCPL